MTEDGPITHDYKAKDPAEQTKLDALAAIRCKVSSQNPTQPHQPQILIVFFKNRTIPKAVLEILDATSGEPIELVELTKPMHEYEVGSLAQIGEVDAPKVALPMEKAELLRELRSYNTNVTESLGTLNVYNFGSQSIIITLIDGTKMEAKPHDHAQGIPTGRVASVIG